jgi:hypothetical protein
MNKDWELTEEQFYRLLEWLDPDQEIAANKYGLIQSRLVRFFATRGRVDPENLADQTINIVTVKVDDLSDYVGDRCLYFLGVAKFVDLQEMRNRNRTPPPPLPTPDPVQLEAEDVCLSRCLEELNDDERQLVIDYEEGEKQERIRLRKELARKLDITVNALRIKICRIHSRLRKCLEQCLNELPAN